MQQQPAQKDGGPGVPAARRGENGPRTERGRFQAFANEPGDAGQKRHPADGGQGSEEIQGR